MDKYFKNNLDKKLELCLWKFKLDYNLHLKQAQYPFQSLYNFYKKQGLNNDEFIAKINRLYLRAWWSKELPLEEVIIDFFEKYYTKIDTVDISDEKTYFSKAKKYWNQNRKKIIETNDYYFFVKYKLL